jgi:hypothetical protein
MKFTASFAVLAVFVSQAVVNAAPTPAAYDLEARADFTDGALEEVWSRFYDELLEDVEAREFDDEEISERAPMKKFAQDLAVGLAQKAPGYAKQASQSQQAKARNSVARPHIAPGTGGAGVRPSSSAPKMPAMPKIGGSSRPSIGQQAKGGFSIAGQAKGAFRTRSLDDIEEDIFERAPMKKFAQDLGVGLAQKAPGYAKQYSQSQQSKARNSVARPHISAPGSGGSGRPSSGSSIPKAPAMSKLGGSRPSIGQQAKGGFSIGGQAKGAFRSRSLDLEDDIFERAPMKKFAQDLAVGLAQKAPGYAKQYTQSEQAKVRNQNRTPGFASTVKQTQQAAKPASSLPKIPASSKWNTVKKPSVMAEIKKLRN